MTSIQLRNFRPGDEEYPVKWREDVEFCLANGWTVNLSADQVRQHWRRIISNPSSNDLRFAIEMDGRVIGYVVLDFLTGESGELGIAIGESGLWGQGVGKQAARLMLKHAFEVLELGHVSAEVHETNERSHALMRRLGFREVGRKGTEEYRGEIVRMVQYEIRRSDLNIQ